MTRRIPHLIPMLVAAFLVPVPRSSAQQPQMRLQPDYPVIEVSGSGESRIAPTRATITLSVETRGPSAKLIAQMNARTQQQVLDTLKALGFTERDVTSMSYNVGPNFEFGPGGRRQDGYVVRNAVRVRVGQLDRIGTVIDAALAKGATGVSDILFEAAETEEARRVALGQAATRARQEAEAVAKAMGGALGELVEASTLRDQRVILNERLELSSFAMSEATPITPSEIVVRATIVARWRFRRD